MRLGPRPASRPWTPADDAQLLTLLDSENGQSFDRPEIETDRVAISKRRAILNKRRLAELG